MFGRLPATLLRLKTGIRLRVCRQNSRSDNAAPFLGATYSKPRETVNHVRGQSPRAKCIRLSRAPRRLSWFSQELTRKERTDSLNTFQSAEERARDETGLNIIEALETTRSNHAGNCGNHHPHKLNDYEDDESRRKSNSYQKRVFINFGWEAGTRTPIARSRVWSPTIGRPPSSEIEFT